MHAQCRHLLAVERDHLRPKHFDLCFAVADGHIHDNADASHDRKPQCAALRDGRLLALDQDAEPALARRRILWHLHLEAVTDGAAAGQGDLGPLDRDPGPATVRLQFILESDAVVRAQREVRRVYVELGGRGGTIGELEYLADHRTRPARQLEARR